MDNLERFLNFAEQSPTAFQAIANLKEDLREAGYRELKEKDPWLVDAGSRYFVTRNDSAIIAFSVPRSGFAPFRIAAAHSDSPTFKLKPHFEDETEKGLPAAERGKIRRHDHVHLAGPAPVRRGAAGDPGRGEGLPSGW